MATSSNPAVATDCPEEAIVELANGCICCTVADDFLPAIEALTKRRSSARPYHRRNLRSRAAEAADQGLRLAGRACPSHRRRCDRPWSMPPRVAAGRFADDPEAVLAQRLDDPSVDHDNPLEEVYEDQLLAADLVVLNKADLLTPDELARVTGGYRRRIAPRRCVSYRPPKARSRRKSCSVWPLPPRTIWRAGRAITMASANTITMILNLCRRNRRRQRYRQPDRPAEGGGRSARYPAHQGLRGNRRQADAPPGPGCWRSLPPRLRPALAGWAAP